MAVSWCNMRLFYLFQVLNETSLWWFDQTRHITSNAVISAPDKNVTIAKKCTIFPVEFVGKLVIYLFIRLFILSLGINYRCSCFSVSSLCCLLYINLVTVSNMCIYDYSQS